MAGLPGRLGRWSTSVAAAALAFTLHPGRLRACTCVVSPETHLEQLVERADAVFYGRVMRLYEGPASLCPSEGTAPEAQGLDDICEIDPEACPAIASPVPLAVVEVLDTFKGRVLTERVVAPDCGAGLCNLGYEPGRTYLIMGQERGKYVFSMACATRPATDDSPVLLRLGHRGSSSGCASCELVSSHQRPARAELWALALLAAVHRRRRRSRWAIGVPQKWPVQIF